MNTCGVRGGLSEDMLILSRHNLVICVILCTSYVLTGICRFSKPPVFYYTGGRNCVRFIIISDFYWSLFFKYCNQNFEYFFHIIYFEIDFVS